jgi:ABC-2 type transport system permease protein
MERVKEVVRKEFRQLRRDHNMLRFLLVVPVIQLLLFGYAISTDIKHIRTVVCDMDRTPESRGLVRVLGLSEHFDVVGYPDRYSDVGRWLDEGRAAVALVIPRGMARRLDAGRKASVQVLLDGSDANTGTVAISYLSGFFRQQTERIAIEHRMRQPLNRRQVPGIWAETRVWYNPMLSSAAFMVPGAMCVIVGLSATIATALAIVKEREIGTMEQLIVTPIGAWELMAGKTLPYLGMGGVNVTAILLANAALFRVPLRGSLALLITVTALFLVASLAVGLLISTVSRTQQQAMLTAFFFLMPNFLLSGFMFPIENMPAVMQWVTYALPLRYFLVIVRGIFLKGSGPADIAGQVWPLALLTFAIMALAVSRFSKRLD